MNVLDFAHQVIKMQERIDRLENEKTHLLWYKEEYHNLMESSTKHNQVMMGNLMKLCLTPGVVEACGNNKTFQHFGVEE